MRQNHLPTGIPARALVHHNFEEYSFDCYLFYIIPYSGQTNMASLMIMGFQNDIMSSSVNKFISKFFLYNLLSVSTTP